MAHNSNLLCDYPVEGATTHNILYDCKIFFTHRFEHFCCYFVQPKDLQDLDALYQMLAKLCSPLSCKGALTVFFLFGYNGYSIVIPRS